ncbi:MAG: hypothetical protein R8P61_35120 [Bacteroidia bacterium]|nr:hypothetical protein [Bacteroidia bacterium]
MRKFLKIFIPILLLIFLGLNLLIDQVDYQPYFQTDYYRESRDRLEKLAQETTLAQGPLEAGFARLSITPSIALSAEEIEMGRFLGLPLAGYGDREGAPVEGVHDSLFVSATALRVGDQTRVLMSADLLIIPPNIAEKTSLLLKERTGLSRDQLFFAATHTHCAMGGWSDRYVGELFAGKLDQELIDWLSERFAEVIEEAVADIQAARMGSTSFQAGEMVYNRLIEEDGREDGEFLMLKIQQLEGKTALLGSFDAHATTLPGSTMEFSADYPGFWRNKLEESGIDRAIFFAGSVGSHGPEGKGDGFEQASYIGLALADSVLKYMDEINLQDSSSLSSLTLEMGMPEFQVRVSEGMSLDSYASSQLFPTLGKVHVQALRIGNLIWATAPGDFSGELAINLKNAMYRKGFYSLISSFNGGYTGYIIPAKYYHFDSYESRMMSWFGPGNGPYMDEMIRRCMEHLSEQK